MVVLYNFVRSELILMRKPAIFIAILFALGLLFPCASAADRDLPVLRVGYTDVPGYISNGEDG